MQRDGCCQAFPYALHIIVLLGKWLGFTNTMHNVQKIQALDSCDVLSWSWVNKIVNAILPGSHSISIDHHKKRQTLCLGPAFLDHAWRLTSVICSIDGMYIRASGMQLTRMKEALKPSAKVCLQFKALYEAL